MEEIQILVRQGKKGSTHLVVVCHSFVLLPAQMCGETQMLRFFNEFIAKLAVETKMANPFPEEATFKLN